MASKIWKIPTTGTASNVKYRNPPWFRSEGHAALFFAQRCKALWTPVEAHLPLPLSFWLLLQCRMTPNFALHWMCYCRDLHAQTSMIAVRSHGFQTGYENMASWLWLKTSGQKRFVLTLAGSLCKTMNHFSDAQPIVVFDTKLNNNRLGNCRTVVSLVRRINYLITLYGS